jgi:predicted O-linked N-acetylglucosamine transferase (SPINDLY family)
MLWVTDTIGGSAREYVGLTVRAGLDSAWRARVSARMQRRHGQLFDDRAPVRALEWFYWRAVRNAPAS